MYKSETHNLDTNYNLQYILENIILDYQKYIFRIHHS